MCKKYAIDNDLNNIDIFGNTFDFYAVYPANGHSDGASIVREVDIKDVLLCHFTVKGFSDTDQDLFLINRDPKGIFTISQENIEVDDIEASLSGAPYSRFESAMSKTDRRYSEAYQGLYDSFRYEPPIKVMYIREVKRSNFEAKFSAIGGKIGRFVDGSGKKTLSKRHVESGGDP